MTRPSFLVIGAQKAATTSLFHYLRGHPDVFMPDWKEPGFFVEEHTWARGVGWYESLFADAPGPVAGEASTAYTMYPFHAGVPARIRSVVPDVRLVYLLRDPVDRMRSAYANALAAGQEARPIRDALLSGTGYLAVSQYALQVEQYLEHFPRDQILLVLSSDLAADPLATTNRVFGHIGVDPWSPPDVEVRYHRSAPKRAPRVGTRLVGGALVRGMHAVGRYRPGGERSRPDGRLWTREIRPGETVVDDDLRGRLGGMLRPDIVRIREHLAAAGHPGFDGWGIA